MPCHLESSCTFGGAFSSSYKTLVRVQRLIESMNNANVDVIVYPTWSNPPRLIGDYYSADGAKTDRHSSTLVILYSGLCAELIIHLSNTIESKHCHQLEAAREWYVEKAHRVVTILLRPMVGSPMYISPLYITAVI